MRKICLINQNSENKISLNIFSRLAKEKKRVLIIDLRENKKINYKKTVGLDIYHALNEIEDLRKFIISIENNLDLIKGNEFLNYQEFNLFYDLFKFDYFEKKCANLNYDYIILEVSDSLNLFTTNALFYSSEVILNIEIEKQGIDFLNKCSRFIYHFNNIYGKQLFISKVIPTFKEKINPQTYTFLISEFTSKLISYPIIDIKNWEFGQTLDKLAINIIDEEKIFDSEIKNNTKQKRILEFLEIINDKHRNEIPLNKFN